MKAYCGYIKNKQNLLNVSSGGAITTISRAFLRNGGCIFGTSYTNRYRDVEYICVENIEDLIKLKGTKYTFPSLGKVIDILEEKLKKEIPCLFIGLGCVVNKIINQIQLRKIPTNNLYCIDIICHGPVVRGVHKAFVEQLENEYNAHIVDLNLRYKYHGWVPFYIYAEFDNGKKFLKQFNKTNYGKVFHYVAMPACLNCAYKGEKHCGDICCGDYWGLTKEMKEYNSNGVSLVLVQSKKGEKLVSLLDNEEDFILMETNTEFALSHNPMYSESRKDFGYYDDFVNDFKVYGLAYAVSKFSIPKDALSVKIKEIVEIIYAYIKRN